MNHENELEYAGFWLRALASIIDVFLILAITVPVLFMVYGVEDYLASDDWIEGPVDFLLSYVMPPLVEILFWIYYQATPGKMVIRSKIIDAKTGEKPTPAQCVGRYFAYYLSMLVFGLGFLWAAFDKKKQGWHDKLAGTVVVRTKNAGTEKVEFNN